MTNKKYLANAIRALAMDAVQQANSGHPGMPMGMADIAEVLWNDFLKFNPKNPAWFNRDRFVLSNGHGSMVLYAILHLTGYDLSIEDLKQFRQLHSKTPGHPEVGETPGVETTTGPLGQGLANAVGMAIAEEKLACDFNRDHFKIVDHYTYVFLGDGCLMEGISHEACSLAGTLGLGKLIAFWDDNGISIDGKVVDWFQDNTPLRFRAYHWHVIENVDGHDSEAIDAAIREAKSITDKPSLICCKTVIGFGSPNKAGSEKCHGSPLGDAEISASKASMNWPHAAFVIPKEIYQAFDATTRGQLLEKAWQTEFDEYSKVYPELAMEYQRRMTKQLPKGWDTLWQNIIAHCNSSTKPNATRKSSLEILNLLEPALPELFGGSADLSESNCSKAHTAKNIRPHHFDGNYLHYGVREFGMSAIMNGLRLSGGLIPYGGTFLVFSDYARNAIRLAALMKQKVIFVYSHDSIGLGEDGPTHQPVEQLSSLRLIPGLDVWRPADATETAIAWKLALEHENPSCILLSRQNLAQYQRSKESLASVARGAYNLVATDKPDMILMATGSEVELAVEAAKQLTARGKAVNVVSMPCMELFEKQDQAYKDSVLPKSVKHRVAIEAGRGDLWYKYVGDHGNIVGVEQFGLSAPYQVVYEQLGFGLDSILTLIA